MPPLTSLTPSWSVGSEPELLVTGGTEPLQTIHSSNHPGGLPRNRLYANPKIEMRDVSRRRMAP